MYWYSGSVVGMSLLWWFFWVVILIAFFSYAVPVPRRRMRLYDDPLEILRRRYAAGDISTEEYEDRRLRLTAEALPVFHPTRDVPIDRRRQAPRPSA